MKPTFMIMALAVLLITASCNPAQNKSTEQPVAKEQNMSAILGEDCFDEKMERWFVAFNEFQAQGLDMNTANEKAIGTVASEFKSCNETHQHQLASE